jgi:diguanylate cyclase (GGDEF)-like protein
MIRQAAAAGTPLTRAVESNGAGRPEALVESYRRLAEVFHEVLSEQALDALLERIAATLGDLMPYEALHIYEADEARRQLVPILARSAEYEEEIMRDRPAYGVGLTGWAAEHRTPVWTNQAHLDPRTHVIPGTPNDPEAIIVVPLVARGTLKGALNIYRIGEDAAFVEHEFELAKWFGDAAALALDNAQTRARLEHLAQTDSLTGLYNHRYFHERLRAELTRASRTHESVAVLMFDLDDFKRVNDVYGHGAGDQLLTRVGRIARDTVRGSDVVCRIGGEEFAVIMPSCEARSALVLAGRLAGNFAAEEFEPTGPMTVSIGIALGPQHAMNPRELAACAEAGMMTAKTRGKNQFVLFDEDAANERPASASTSTRDLRSISHLKMLQSIAGKLNRLNDVRKIGETIAEELRLLIDYHNCRVVLREGDDLRPVAFIGERGETAVATTEAYTVKVGEGVTGTAVERGESLLVPNALECEFAKRIPGTDDLEESLAVVPLRYGGRVTGAIVISKLGTNQFDEDDVRLLEVLAGQASVALENALLYERQRHEAENAKALLAFVDAVSRAQSFDDICTLTVATAASLFQTERVSLWLDDVCAASFGEPLAEGIEGLLVEGDGILGRLVLALEPDGDEQERLLASFTSQASVALQKARLYWKQLEAAEIANTLLEASRELATAEAADETLARCVDVTRRALGTTTAGLWVQHERASGDLVSVAAYGADRSTASFPAALAQKWLRGTEPFVLEREMVVEVSGVEFEQAGRFIVAPLHLDGGRVGALTAQVGDRRVADRELRLFAGLGHQATLAIESAEHYAELERTFVSTIAALANALEANDEYSSSHARWITDMALLVGRALELDGEALKRLELGALFHDIGKIGVPSEILQKAGPLTDEEFEVVKSHPELGEKILAPIDRLADVRPIVRACHERWDGLGYPDGRKGDDIPLEARIVLVCDAFHAMVTDRPYRSRLPGDEAVLRLGEASGSQFDPVVVDAFLRLYDAGAVLPY